MNSGSTRYSIWRRVIWTRRGDVPKRFYEWLVKHGSQDPEVEAAKEQVRALLDLLHP
jgi:hypothetical protein